MTVLGCLWSNHFNYQTFNLNRAYLFNTEQFVPLGGFLKPPVCLLPCSVLNSFTSFLFWYFVCLSLTIHLLPQNHTHASTDRFRHTSVVEWSIFTFNKFVFLCRLVDRFCTSVFTVISLCCRFSPFPTKHRHTPLLSRCDWSFFFYTDDTDRPKPFTDSQMR